MQGLPFRRDRNHDESRGGGGQFRAMCCASFNREEWRRVSDFALMLHAPTGVTFEIGGVEPEVYAQLVYVPDAQSTHVLSAEVELGRQAGAAFRDEFQRMEVPECTGPFWEKPKVPVVH